MTQGFRHHAGLWRSGNEQVVTTRPHSGYRLVGRTSWEIITALHASPYVSAALCAMGAERCILSPVWGKGGRRRLKPLAKGDGEGVGREGKDHTTQSLKY